MSRENVEVVRRGIEAWNAGDMDAFREMHDPDVIVRTVADWPEPGPYVGREAVMRSFEQLRDTWDVETLEVTSDFIDAGDRVVVRLIWHGVGQGPQLNLELTDVLTVRKGRIRGTSTSGITRKPSKPLGCGSRQLASASGRRSS